MQGNITDTSASITTPESSGQFSDGHLKITYVDNTEQNIIIIPEERLELYIRDFKENVTSIAGSKGDAGLCISSLTVLSTSTFHDFLGVDATIFKTLFVLLLFGSFVHFLCNFPYRHFFWKTSGIDKAYTPRDLVRLCKRKKDIKE